MIDREIMPGVLLDEEEELTLGELCSACGVSAEYVLTLVEEGLVEPRREAPERWRFPAAAVIRTRTVVRLQHDLDLNVPGAALALQLLDEVRQLRARVRALERLLEE